jgi:hypothetical protein
VSSGATGNTVEGNYIGTDVTGSVDLGNSRIGVYITGANNTIGGTATGAGNVISGNDYNGLVITFSGGTGNSNTVEGNYVGTQADGVTALGNTLHGVWILGPASDNTVGGTAGGAGNTIAFNSGDGVRVQGASITGNTIRGNSIHSNTGKGIENIDGGNTELTPPSITAAGSASGTSSCTGCTVEVFSDAADEGKRFHGSTTTDGGTGAWSFTGAVVGPNVTATVTDGSGNTSEFSTPFVADSDGDGFLDSVDNCPDTANPGQENQDGDPFGDACETADCIAVATAWVTPPGDEDCDGWTTAGENFIGTDPDLHCGPGAWPPDFNDSLQVDIFDALFFAPPVFFSTAPGPPYSPRFDLVPNGTIDIFDVLKMAPPMFFATCTP